MTRRLLLATLLCAISAACRGPTARPSPPPRGDDGLTSVIRTLVEDSAMAGAGRADRPATAADPATARLLHEAGYHASAPDGGEMLLCPGSTLANGAPPTDTRGYYLKLEVLPDARAPTDSTVRVIHVTHFCRFMYQGEFSRGGLFSTTAFWEVRLREGRWRISRMLGRSIT